MLPRNGCRAGFLCRLGVEQCTGWSFCLHPVYPAHPVVLGMLRRCRRDAKGSPACSHWIHSFPWKLAVLQRWLFKEPSLLPSCCPSHPGSPEDAAVAQWGQEAGRMEGWMSRGTGRNGAAFPLWLGQGRAWLDLACSRD